MKCIIVDDEAPARRALARLCEKVEDLSVVASYSNSEDAARLLEKESVDLMLVAARVSQTAPSNFGQIGAQIILVTDGQEETGLLGNQAIDFLSKPISVDRLSKAVERVRLRKRLLAPNPDAEEIYLRSDGNLIRIRYDDLLFAETTDFNEIAVHTPFETLRIKISLRDLAAKLADTRFAKVKRNFLVNLQKVHAVGETSITIAQTEIPISRAIRPMVVRQVESYR